MTNQNAAIRRQMIGSLTEEDLRGLCFDHFPNIYDELTTGMTMSRMVELLLNWCMKNGRFRDLQVGLHRINPQAFPHIYLVEDRPKFMKAALVTQTTHAITPPFPRSKIPITRIEIEVHHIQEKVHNMLTPLWLFVISTFLVLIMLVLVFLVLPLPNIAEIAVVRTVSDLINNAGQSPPIPTMIATPSATSMQTTLDLARPPANPKLFDTWLRPQDDMQMIFVPGDQNLSGFWLDQTEVNNQQYDRCVSAGHCNASALAAIADYHHPIYPVVGVSWFYATAYCEWVAGELPTELQWQHAVGGFQNTTYPWGEDEPTCDLAQYNDCKIGLAAVGSKPAGQSWAGAYDLAGNVWEWVRMDSVEMAVSATNVIENPDVQPIRGGGWNADPHQLQNSIRKNENPNNWLDHLGFRCVYPD